MKLPKLFTGEMQDGKPIRNLCNRKVDAGERLNINDWYNYIYNRTLPKEKIYILPQNTHQ